MKNRVYYGEYSLKHWIDLILRKNITLPPYQRSFVWNEDAVLRFVKSLKNNEFVPPVTIAYYKPNDNDETNFILDGQQRLTTVLLAFLGYYPDKEKFKVAEKIGEEDDGALDEDNIPDNNKKPIEWTFRELLNDSVEPNNIKKDLDGDKRYKKLEELNLDDSFFENTFLGFSYVIPETTVQEEIQKNFSLIFRNINYLGSSLSLLESRKSLYFLNNQFEKFFDAKTTENEDIFCGLKILDNLQPCKIDFVRYLSTLSQYSIRENIKEVLKGYSAYKSRENYYADYVSYLVGLEQDNYKNKFDGFDFNSTFPDNIWESRFTTLRGLIGELKKYMTLDKDDSFKSWIDADYWMYGLIYVVLFRGKQIEIDEELTNSLKKAIDSKKKDTNYAKSPNRLGYLRERLDDSIKIYSRYEK